MEAWGFLRPSQRWPGHLRTPASACRGGLTAFRRCSPTCPRPSSVRSLRGGQMASELCCGGRSSGVERLTAELGRQGAVWARGWPPPCSSSALGRAGALSLGHPQAGAKARSAPHCPRCCCLQGRGGHRPVAWPPPVCAFFSGCPPGGWPRGGTRAGAAGGDSAPLTPRSSRAVVLACGARLGPSESQSGRMRPPLSL